MMQDCAEYYPPTPRHVPPELTRPTLRYRLQAALVVASLFLFLAVYLSLLAGCAGFSYWALSKAIRAFATRNGSFPMLLLAGAGVLAWLLALYFIKGLFKFQRRDPLYLEITEAEQPRLFAFIRQVCADTGAPQPARIVVSPLVNAGVYYASTFWSLFFPVRKNLHIGLGLVNCLTLSEFKAVMAHEFGHFSQSSMRLGTYVYTANHIIHEIIYGRDWVDNSLSFCNPVLGVVRWALGAVYRVIGFAHASLSRQMEFQADLVAVSVSGSDAIIHGLLRTDFAQNCLDVTWQDLNAAADHQLQTQDLFCHQTRTAEYLRQLRANPLLGIPPELPEEAEPGLPVFPPNESVLPPMWASHPPHYQRELNCKCTYVRGPQDDRSAWVLFDDPAALRQRVTQRHYELVHANKSLRAEPAETVQRFIDEDRAETVYSARYHGLYAEGFIAPGQIDTLMKSLPPRYEQPGKLIGEHAAIFSPELRQRLQEYQERCADRRRLIRFAQKIDVPRAGVFQFRDKQYRVADAAGLVKILEAEIKADHAHLAALDRRIFLVYMAMARQLDEAVAQELEQRYRFHLGVQEMISALSRCEAQVNEAFQLMAAKRDPNPQIVQAAVIVVRDSQRVLEQQLHAATHLKMPALKNLRAGEPLAYFLDAKPVVSGLIGTEQIVQGTWVKEMLQRQAEVIDKLRRILFKSLGSLLCFQERVGEHYKARFTAPRTLAPDIRDTRTAAPAARLR